MNGCINLRITERKHNRYTCPGGSALRRMIHGGSWIRFFTPATALLEILMERVHREE